jgi:hypothetical protein
MLFLHSNLVSSRLEIRNPSIDNPDDGWQALVIIRLLAKHLIRQQHGRCAAAAGAAFPCSHGSARRPALGPVAARQAPARATREQRPACINPPSGSVWRAVERLLAEGAVVGTPCSQPLVCVDEILLWKQMCRQPCSRESARTCGGQQCGVASDIFMLSDVLLLTFLFPNPSTIASKKRSALHGDDEVGSPAATVYLYGELLLCQIGYKG